MKEIHIILRGGQQVDIQCSKNCDGLQAESIGGAHFLCPTEYSQAKTLGFSADQVVGFWIAEREEPVKEGAK